MDIIAGLLASVPPPWIRAANRWRRRHPRCAPLFEGVARWFRGRDGLICRGAGLGLRFNPGQANAGSLLGLTEPDVQDAMQRVLKRGMTVYDVGANVGFHTLIAARLVGSEGRVIALEPVAENAATLRRNAALNDFACVEVLELAAAGRDGPARFCFSALCTRGNLEGCASPPQVLGIAEVPAWRLDSLVRDKGMPEPDLIKIDVEGAEAEVLLGASQTLMRSRPLLLIELHGTKDAVFEILERHGYDALELHGPDKLLTPHFLGVPREARSGIDLARP